MQYLPHPAAASPSIGPPSVCLHYLRGAVRGASPSNTVRCPATHFLILRGRTAAAPPAARRPACAGRTSRPAATRRRCSSMSWPPRRRTTPGGRVIRGALTWSTRLGTKGRATHVRELLGNAGQPLPKPLCALTATPRPQWMEANRQSRLQHKLGPQNVSLKSPAPPTAHGALPRVPPAIQPPSGVAFALASAAETAIAAALRMNVSDLPRLSPRDIFFCGWVRACPRAMQPAIIMLNLHSSGSTHAQRLAALCKISGHS
jgi:hypothetical protein